MIADLSSTIAWVSSYVDLLEAFDPYGLWSQDDLLRTWRTDKQSLSPGQYCELCEYLREAWIKWQNDKPQKTGSRRKR
jgi:hypothetical protein